jgi:hypothetical protein
MENGPDVVNIPKPTIQNSATNEAINYELNVSTIQEVRKMY